MEIGLDYMHLRSRAGHYGLRWTGIAVLLVGIAIAIAGASYYGYFFWLRFELNSYQEQRPELVRADAPPVAPGKLTVRHLALPPGVGAEYAAAQRFTPTDGAAPPDAADLLPAAKLRIPGLALKVDLNEQISTRDPSSTDELVIRRAGQLKESVNPGARGALWFLGPAGGNVADSFSGLKDAPAYLAAAADELQIIVSTDAQEYLYLATHADVIPDNKFNFSKTDRATVHLAVPVPNGVHDHFLILSGELVGVR